MWDEFSIGDVGSSASATTVTDNISENAEAYWWDHPTFGLGGKISKGSPQGKKIAKLIDSCTPNDKVDAYILKVAIPELSVARIVGIFTQIREDAYREGDEHRTLVIREALGV